MAIRHTIARFPVTVFMVGALVTQVLLTASQHHGVRNYGLGLLRIPSPAIWALLVASIAWGKKDAWKLVSSLWNWRVKPGYYVMALAYPPGVAIVSLLILRAVGLNERIELDLVEPAKLEFAWLCFRISTVEEIAWVGFLLQAFSKRWTLFQAASLMGLCWGIWYIPLILTNIQVTPNLPLLPLLINFMSIAAICGWLYYRTRSAGVVCIMQLMTNYTTQLIPVLPQRGGETQYVAFVLVKALFSILLFAVWGPKPLFGKTNEGRSSLEAIPALP